MSISDWAGTCTSTILPSLSVTCQVSGTPSTWTTVARSGCCPKALGARSMAAAHTRLSRCRVPGEDWQSIALLLSVTRTPPRRSTGRKDTSGAEGTKVSCIAPDTPALSGGGAPAPATTRALRTRESQALAVVTGTSTPTCSGIAGHGRLVHPGPRDTDVVLPDAQSVPRSLWPSYFHKRVNVVSGV